MKNKILLKKFLFKLLITSVIVIILSLIITNIEYHVYTKNMNTKIESIINAIQVKYPNLTLDEIITILNSETDSTNILSKYNIDIDKDSIILENEEKYQEFMIINMIFIIITIISFTALFLKYNNNKDKKISEITKYLEEINKRNYTLNLDDISESELSILKNEIYKTTIMLKENALASSKEKIELKASLEDISHQLKTPLTSILIIIDALIDDPNMPLQTRQDFILDIKREINSLNFLVQNLLKLSKLDTNTVKFNKEKVTLKTLIDKVVEKLEILCDLKNININIKNQNNGTINADITWQVEAISNILKNSLEHSKVGDKIDIELDSNKIYSQITIKDYGIGIDGSDLPHIFERFYKGSETIKDSNGIGLALAKKIIEQSGGKIFVTSKKGEGTTFKIRYY